jgi:hypothetical protein
MNDDSRRIWNEAARAGNRPLDLESKLEALEFESGVPTT